MSEPKPLAGRSVRIEMVPLQPNLALPSFSNEEAMR
jgi:hypothetical protein